MLMLTTGLVGEDPHDYVKNITQPVSSWGKNISRMAWKTCLFRNISEDLGGGTDQAKGGDVSFQALWVFLRFPNWPF